MRTVVTHIHLFKNAGTSIEQALERSLGERWASYDGVTAASLLSVGMLADFLEQSPDLVAVSSHHIRPPLQGITGYRFLPIVFLRHPIDRIRSAYDFERQQQAPTPSSVAAGSTDLDGWIDFHRGRKSTQVANFQTLALSSLRDEAGKPSSASPVEHRRSAEEFVAELPAFGLVERFNESCHWINTWLRDAMPLVQLEAKHANTTQDRATDLGARLDQVRDALGASGYERLLEENNEDLMLWEWATSHASDGIEAGRD